MTITGQSRFGALKTLKALGANLTEQQIADALAISVMSQAEAEAGTATTIRFVTAQRIAQAIAALVLSPSEHDNGEQTTGTLTPDPVNGPLQLAENGGAHTLAPPGKNGDMKLIYTNNANAGAITTSGFTHADDTAFTTTNGERFLCEIVEINSISYLRVTALQ